MRKTVSVDDLRNRINSLLARPTALVTTEEKRALCSLLEGILFDTGNYKGYGWPALPDKAYRPRNYGASVKSGDKEYFTRHYY